MRQIDSTQLSEELIFDGNEKKLGSCCSNLNCRGCCSLSCCFPARAREREGNGVESKPNVTEYTCLATTEDDPPDTILCQKSEM